MDNKPNAVELPIQRTVHSNLHITSDGMVIAVIIVGALYFGRELFIPIALAALIAFVLDPLVEHLRRWRIHRGIAVTVAVIVTFSVFAGVGLFVSEQLRQLGKELPTYQTNVIKKMRAMRVSLREPGMLDPFSRLAGTVSNELEAAKKDIEVAAKRAAKSPARVEVVSAPPSASENISMFLQSISGPLVMAGIVFIFLILMLINKSDIQERIVRLLGHNLNRTSEALQEIGDRISRYLTMQLIVNTLYAVPLGLALWWIGIPGAVVWAIMAGLLRFVPYLGPVISSAFPLLLAFAIDPTWSTLAFTVSALLLIELVSNNLVEPWLYGQSTGLSAFSLIISASFWALLWGPVGLILSTPLTVCLLVIGKYVPRLSFFDILLGSTPALDNPSRLYQRLLSGNVDSAVEMALAEVAAESPSAFYADTAIPALRLASDAHALLSTVEQRLHIANGMNRIVEELKDDAPSSFNVSEIVLCIGGKWDVDRISAAMSAHAINLAGIPAQSVSTVATTPEFVRTLDIGSAAIVCLCYFSPQPLSSLNHVAGRIRRRWENVHIVAALWNVESEFHDSYANGAQLVDTVVFGLNELINTVEYLQTQAIARSNYLPAPIPVNEAERMRALTLSGILAARHRGVFDVLAKRAADVFDMELAMVNVIDQDCQLTHGNSTKIGRAELGDAELDTSRDLSMCGHVVASAAPLVVGDTKRDPRFANNPLILERGIRFYAGVPLFSRPDHFVLGALCLIDSKPRSLNQREVVLLQKLAEELMDKVYNRQL